MQMQFSKVNWILLSTHGWGGQTCIAKIQVIQDRVTKVILGHKAGKLSSLQREKAMNWLSVREEITLATMRMMHSLINQGIPEEMASIMPLNQRNLRLIQARKLDTKPRELNKNERTQASFRNWAYYYNTLPNRLTEISEKKWFNKWLKVFLKNLSKPPNPIPKFTPFWSDLM